MSVTNQITSVFQNGLWNVMMISRSWQLNDYISQNIPASVIPYLVSSFLFGTPLKVLLANTSSYPRKVKLTSNSSWWEVGPTGHDLKSFFAKICQKSILSRHIVNSECWALLGFELIFWKLDYWFSYGVDRWIISVIRDQYQYYVVLSMFSPHNKWKKGEYLKNSVEFLCGGNFQQWSKIVQNISKNGWLEGCLNKWNWTFVFTCMSYSFIRVAHFFWGTRLPTV